jgi:hypothetical protein
LDISRPICVDKESFQAIPRFASSKMMARSDILTSVRGEISRTLGLSGGNDRLGAYELQKTTEQSASADPGTPVAKSKGGRKAVCSPLTASSRYRADVLSDLHIP